MSNIPKHSAATDGSALTHDFLQELSKEQLVNLLEIYAKNWLALDGFWFLSLEEKLGMDKAMEHDVAAWRQFTVTEANRLKEFLGLSERPGLEGLAQALHLRLYGRVNKHSCEICGNKLIFRNIECRVQTARARKGMEFHPCKEVAMHEYSGFGTAIDDRITCRCLSCYPDCTEDATGCAWEYTLYED